MGGSGMAAPPLNPNQKAVGGREESAGPAGHNARGMGGVDMQCKGGCHAIQCATLYHVLGPALALLRWLEEQAHGACQLRLSGLEQPRRAQQHRHVGVVAAGVHEARAGRGIGQPSVLLDGQAIHVGAQRHDWFALADAGHDAGAGHGVWRGGHAQVVQHLSA